MSILRISVAATTCFLVSCSTVTGEKGPPAALTRTVSPHEVYYDTQVVMGGCPSSQEVAPLVAAVGAAMVAQGISRVGDALKAAGNADTQTALARRNVEMNTSTGLPTCVLIARGWFYRNPPIIGDPTQNPPVKAWPFKAKEGSAFPATENDVDLMFWRLGLHLAATPDFYFRGEVVRSTDQSAYAIKPVEALLETPISTNTFRPSGKRSVVVALALSDAGTGVDLSKGGGATLVLGAMLPGKLIEYPHDKVDCSAWLYLDATGARDTTKKKYYDCPGKNDFAFLDRSPFESNWFTIKLSDKPSKKPMGLQALVTETRSASRFLQFVGDVFSSTKDSLTKEAQQALIPPLGEQAEVSDKAADDAKKTALDTAIAKAISDLKACQAAPTDPGKRVAARISVRAVVTAGRGRVADTDALTPDSITTEGTTATPCDAELAKIVALKE
ncbi:hypothetical protein [Luteibacter yeojuensis]